MSTPASPLHSASTHGAAPTPAWKQELHERLRDHRMRRGAESAAQPIAPRSHQAAASPSTVAARVAERYREAPSYRDLLQARAEAARAATQAAEAAHRVAHCAEEVVEAFPILDLNREPDREPEAAPPYQEFQTSSGSALAIEHHAPLPERPLVPERKPAVPGDRALVDAFAEAVVPAAQSLPAKLIEFPRELVARSKRRPRLAEGPLLEEQREQGSLRIFEVSDFGLDARSDSASQTPLPEPSGAAAGTMEVEARSFSPYDAPVPTMSSEIRRETTRRAPFVWEQTEEHARSEYEEIGWGSIELGAHPDAGRSSETQVSAQLPAQRHSVDSTPLLQDLAPVGDRLMAALVDASIVFASFLFSVLVFASCTTHLPVGKAALLEAFLFLGVLAVFYGWLFMSFGGGSTPGMRYAQIALCTFRDENPTRRQLQHRVPATALALLPLGLGVLWALLDADKLGWHDRMTRTYQRTYARQSR